MEDTRFRGPFGWLKRLEARADAWAAKRLAPDELEEALELDRRLKRHFWRWLGIFAAACATLALLLYAIKPRFGFLESLAVSTLLAVGLLICFVSAFYGWRKFRGPLGWKKLAGIVALAALGAMVGGGMATLSTGRSIPLDPESLRRMLAVGLLVGLALAMGIAAVVSMRMREARQREARLAAEAEREKLSRQGAQAELKLLQAQVEPHFLFNTLANLRFLVQTGSPDALAMLDHLIHYLRTALPEIRAEGSTVGREVELARAYLEILRIRMGGALEIETFVEPALEREPIPPLMVMTLVENAIKHGIAPRGRGRVVVRASAIGRGVRIAVEDDGRGIVEPIGRGVGLANIRERLRGLFGDRARLELASREGGGTVAAIEIAAAAPAAPAA